MTIYATLDDIIARAGQDEILQVADRDGDGGADPDVVSAAIAAAGHTIDAYLAVRYALPLSAVPEVVRGWAVSLARYSLHRYDPPEYVVRDQKAALFELAQAGAGKMVVTGAAGLAPDRSPDGAAMAEGSEPVFTRANLEGWL